MAKKFVLKEGTISIGGVQLQIKDGQVNPEDQSPEGMDLLQKIANAINGSDDVQINLPGGGAQGGIPGGMPPEGAMGTGGPLEPGGPPMDDMGGDIGGDMGGPPPKIGGIGGGPEDDMGGPPPGISDDEGGPPPEIGDSEDEGEGEDEGEEGKEEGEEEEDEGEGEGEGEEEEEGEGEEDEGDDEDDDKGPPKKGPPEKGKNPFADDINRIAACITEDINVNNGKLLAEDVKKK